MAYFFLCLLFSNRTHILNHITCEYLLVVGSPPHIEPPLPIRMNPLAKHPGGQLDRVAAHPLRATPLLQLGDRVPDAGHVARVEEVEDPRRERKLTELEFDPRAFETFARGVPGFRALARP